MHELWEDASAESVFYTGSAGHMYRLVMGWWEPCSACLQLCTAPGTQGLQGRLHAA
jgi:hypothetical protein